MRLWEEETNYIGQNWRFEYLGLRSVALKSMSWNSAYWFHGLKRKPSKHCVCNIDKAEMADDKGELGYVGNTQKKERGYYY